MGIQALVDHIGKTTVEYRKGEKVTERDVGNVHVVEVYAMPPVPDKGVLVDVHFMKIGFTEAVDKEEFIKALAEAVAGDGEGYYQNINAEQFLGGPSYIAIGAWLGSQDLALRLIALVEFYGLGTVITPQVMFRDTLPEEAANEFAGRGFVMPAPNAELQERLRPLVQA